MKRLLKINPLRNGVVRTADEYGRAMDLKLYGFIDEHVNPNPFHF